MLQKIAVMQMPKVIFIPCARSHRFERREIEVFEEVKVRYASNLWTTFLLHICFVKPVL